MTQVSNPLGIINPVEEIISLAHSRDISVLVDGTVHTASAGQCSAHGCGFRRVLQSKFFGAAGIGALYGKSHLLKSMPPWQRGGHRVRDVTFGRTVYNHPPEKFGAGAPDIAGVVGLAAAIDHRSGIGIPAIAACGHSLLECAIHALAGVRKLLRPHGDSRNKASVPGFVIPGLTSKKPPAIWITMESPCAPRRAITARCPPCGISVLKARSVRRWLSTTPSVRWMPWCPLRTDSRGNNP